MFRRSTFAALIAFCTLLPFAMTAQEFAVRPQFEFAGHFHAGLAPALQGGLWGFVNTEGNWVVRPQFEAVKAGSDRRYGVQSRGLWGYLDNAGQLVIPFRFKEANQFSEGVAAVSENGRDFFVIDTDGNDTNKGARFDQISLMHDGLATVRRDGGEWTVLPRGSAEPAYRSYLAKNNSDMLGGVKADIEALTAFSDGVGFMLHDGKYRVVRYNAYSTSSPLSMPDGERDIDRFPTFISVRPFSNGLAAVSSDGVSWGFIDRNARFVIRPQFEAAREFSEGVAPVRLNGLWGYADRSGAIVLSPSFDRAYSFREGFATTRKGDLRGFLLMGSDGRITNAYPPQFQDVYSFQEGLAPVKTGGLWGFIKAPGVELRALPPIKKETALKALRP